MKRVRSDDREALGEMYARCHRDVLAYLLVRVHDRTLAEDLASEVWLEVSTRPARLPADLFRPVVAWLVGMARRKLQLYHWRRAQEPCTESLDETWDGDGPGGDLRYQPAAPCQVPVVDPLDGLETRLGGIGEAMRGLSAREREALLLYGEGHSVRQLAELMGTHTSQAQEVIQRALGRMRQVLVGAEPIRDRRLCACGCGHELPPDLTEHRRFATSACRRRIYRRRQREGHRPLRLSAEAPTAQVRTLAAVGDRVLTVSEIAARLGLSSRHAWVIRRRVLADIPAAPAAHVEADGEVA